MGETPELHGPDLKIGGMPVIEFYPEEKQIRILDVALQVLDLPRDVQARRFIPSWENLKSSTCWDTPTVMLIRDMAIRLNGGVSSRNEGPTGVSKSFAAEVICALTNRSYLRHNYSKEADIGDTIGRFIPSDSRLAVRFEELLGDPELKGEARKVVEKAQSQSRSLTVYESKKIAKMLGLDGLEDDNHWRWQNGTLTGSMAYGSVYGADEANLAPGNILERENSSIESHPTLRLVEHEGEVIRPLTAEEQSIIKSGGLIPGIIGLDRKYWYVAAQNPFGIGGGRFEESEARRNRLQDRIVEALTPKEYEDFLTYLVHGNQPDIVWQSKIFKGERNMQTPYRDLEQIPNIDVVIRWISQFQHDLQELVLKGKIGTEKDIKGGSYTYTRRNLIRFLDSIKGSQKSVLDVQETLKQKKPVYNTNWHDLVMEAVYQEYLAGMYREDAQIVQELIKATGIEEQLGPSKNNPSLPEWVKRAQKKGIKVTAGPGEWVISRTNIGAGIDLEGLGLKEEGYTASDKPDSIQVKRPVQSILAIFAEKANNRKEAKRKVSKKVNAEK